MIHYLPGCDVRKNHPQAIRKIEKYMKEKGAVIDKCCRTKEKLLEKEDIMISNCMMCSLVIKETHPENKNISLYKYILNDDNFPWVDHHGMKIVVQDCWRTRKNKMMQEAIRECLKRMNITVIEMKLNREKTDFDGVWRNNAIDPVLLEVAPCTFESINTNDIDLLSFQEQEQKMKEWVKVYDSQEVMIYCNGCEKGLKMGGIQPVHLIELIAEGL